MLWSGSTFSSMTSEAKRLLAKYFHVAYNSMRVSKWNFHLFLYLHRSVFVAASLTWDVNIWINISLQRAPCYKRKGFWESSECLDVLLGRAAQAVRNANKIYFGAKIHVVIFSRAEYIFYNDQGQVLSTLSCCCARAQSHLQWMEYTKLWSELPRA